MFHFKSTPVSFIFPIFTGAVSQQNSCYTDIVMAIKDKENGYGSTSRSEPSTSTSSSEGECSQVDHRDSIDDLKATVPLNDVDDHSARALTNFQRFSYGVGHVLNDLTASMWFSYLLIYLQKVGTKLT